MEESNLYVFTNGSEYVIAESKEDAVVVWNNTIGDDYIGDNYGTVDDWKKCEGTNEFRLVMVDESAEILTEHLQVGYKNIVLNKWDQPVVIADFNYWIDLFGRSYLAGEDV